MSTTGGVRSDRSSYDQAWCHYVRRELDRAIDGLAALLNSSDLAVFARADILAIAFAERTSPATLLRSRQIRSDSLLLLELGGAYARSDQAGALKLSDALPDILDEQSECCAVNIKALVDLESGNAVDVDVLPFSKSPVKDCRDFAACIHCRNNIEHLRGVDIPTASREIIAACKAHDAGNQEVASLAYIAASEAAWSLQERRWSRWIEISGWLVRTGSLAEASSALVASLHNALVSGDCNEAVKAEVSRLASVALRSASSNVSPDDEDA